MRRLIIAAAMLLLVSTGVEAAKRISCISESSQTCTVSMISVSGTTPTTVFTDQATTATSLVHGMSDYYYQYGSDLDPALEYRVVCNCSSIGAWSFAYELFETRVDAATSTRTKPADTQTTGAVTLAASQPNYAPAKAGDNMVATNMPTFPANFSLFSIGVDGKVESDVSFSLTEQNVEDIAAGIAPGVLAGFKFDSNGNVKSAPQTVPVVFPVYEGTLINSMATQSADYPVNYGNSLVIPFALNGDYTGFTATFAVKTAYGDLVPYVIGPKVATWTDEAAGTGYITLTADETKLAPKRYVAELKLTKGAEVLTGMRLTLTVKDVVIK